MNEGDDGMTRAKPFSRAGLAAVLFGAGMALAVGSAVAAGSDDPDWPCVQRKVPKITAATMWAGPPIDGLEKQWRGDQELRALAREITARKTPMEDASKAIEAFAASLGSDKDLRLTLLFAASLSSVNAERASLIAGIGRYSRRQESMSKRIEQQQAELGALPRDGGEEVEARREELRERLTWDTRVFEERSRSLTYICDQPVVLEQRIFAVAREIMGYLD